MTSNNKLNKIHIVGAPGSGKTFLARRLAAYYRIPNLDLDNIFWDNNSQYYNTKNSPELRTKQLNEFLLNDSYIIEGVYHEWLEQSFRTADIIVILEVNLLKRIYYVIKRYWRRRFNWEHGKKETLKSTIKLLRWNCKYDTKQLPIIKETLKNNSRVRIFNNADAAYDYILQANSAVERKF